MKNIIKYFLFILIIQYSETVFSQEKSPVKFGKISADDFKNTVYRIDSSAAAVVISDIGSSDIIAGGSWFNVEFKRYKRIHILKKEGYNTANIQLVFFTSGGKVDPFESLKAVTYNLENGQVIESKLNKKESVYTDMLSKNVMAIKFTFPNVKEGSIVELEYKTVSGSVFNLHSWEFQGEYPVLWSEYNAAIPEFFYYLFVPQGYQGYHVKEKKETSRGFILGQGSYSTEKPAFSATINEHRWVMKDVPAMKREPFTATVSNYISKIEFILSAYRYPLRDRNLMLEWKDINDLLLKDEDFGQQYIKDNTWLNDEVNNTVKGLSGNLEKARALFNYTRDNIKCISYNQISPGGPLKEILKNKKGGVADINLLYIAMLRKAGIAAKPVMLSTKPHGYPPVIYPNINKFNYLVCQATIDGKKYYLDASRPQLGFGKLEWECYNGHARIIDETSTGIDLLSDSLTERKITSINISSDENGNFAGYLKQSPGYYGSYKIRKTITEKGREEFFKELQNQFGPGTNIVNPVIDSQSLYEEPVEMTFDIKMENEKNDVIYINPMLGEGYKENPFKSANRLYPVEMPYTIDETYILKMEVPKGYRLEELPRPEKMNYDENGQSFFEYLIAEKGGTISLRSRLKLNRTFFAPEEYEILREFYAFIVKKHNEQIVFKKN